MRGLALFRGKEGRDRSSGADAREAAARDMHLHASRCVGSRAWRLDAVGAPLAFIVDSDDSIEHSAPLESLDAPESLGARALENAGVAMSRRRGDLASAPRGQ